MRRRGPMRRQGTSCSYEAEAKKRRGVSQSGARLPQGLLPLRSLRFGDAIGLSPFSSSRRKRGRGGQKSSICEEFPSSNFLPVIATWANAERREKNPPRRRISADFGSHIDDFCPPTWQCRKLSLLKRYALRVEGRLVDCDRRDVGVLHAERVGIAVRRGSKIERRVAFRICPIASKRLFSTIPGVS